MPFTATVLTMFPEAFPGPLGVSLIGTAWREQDLWRLETVDIRAVSKDKRGFRDDTPAGGGPGQGVKADVSPAARDSVEVSGPKKCWIRMGSWLSKSSARPDHRGFGRSRHRVKHVATPVSSNAAHLQAQVDADSGRIIVISAIDNLGKGAAGQAVQDANLMLGLPEAAGLTTDGIAP